MKHKLISLVELVKLSYNEELSKDYVNYLAGVQGQYRHHEIFDIEKLISILGLGEKYLNGFIYGYSVPQLNKEFDLLKVSTTRCVNIELKSQPIAMARMERQLRQNHHYLKMLNVKDLNLFTFISSEQKLYKLKNESLCECSFDELRVALRGFGVEIDEEINLDEVFTPKNILVSPLNSPEKFMDGHYLLTEPQEDIKKEILSYLEENGSEKFIGINGGPGTGKTLLLYDIVKTLSDEKRILLVHCGILCEGHGYLNEHMKNVRIVSAKEINIAESDGFDIVVIDEAHRLHEGALNAVVDWAKRTKSVCIFSFDEGQKLSNSEKVRKTSGNIVALCGGHIGTLTNKIRTNKELATFINCLRDLGKYQAGYRFPHVKIMFEPDKIKAVEKAKRKSEEEGYTFISYTPSMFYSGLDYQETELNTHKVIGQEFDGVCMIMDDNFYYEDGKLRGKEHPNPDYLFEKLLYQGLTRVRSKLLLIVTDEELLKNILTLMRDN